MPRFAANLTMMFGEVAFPRRFAAARAAGFHAVEFLFPYEHTSSDVARWLSGAELAAVLFNLPPGDWASGERGIAALPGRQDEFRRSVDHAIGYAKMLGTARLHAMAGLVDAGADRTTYVSNLTFAAAALAAEGLELMIEPINTRDMPGYFLSRYSDALAIIAEVGAPNLRLQADLYHLQIIAGDLSAKLAQDIGKIGHIQIASVPDRSEPDCGEIDYRHLLALIDRLGYAGWIGCEYRPRGRTEDGLGWMAPAG